MGLLQRRSIHTGADGPVPQSPSRQRPRKGSVPSQLGVPDMPDDAIHKRKSFVNIFRGLRKDDMPPPPVPSLPIGPAPVSILRTPSSFANGGGPAASRTSLSMPGSPPRPPRPLPGVGVCSTLPPPRPSFSHPHRVYGHSPASSYSSMISSTSGGRRPLLNISAPIPGLGDVPPLPTTSAVFSRERGGDSFSRSISHDNMAGHRHTLPVRPTEATDYTSGHGRTDSVTTNDASDQSPHSGRRIQSHLQDRQSNGYGGEMSPSPPMPSTPAMPPTPAVATVPAPERQSTSEQDFIFDARVAAMLSDPPLPPTTTPFSRITPTHPDTDVFATVQASPLSNIPPPSRQQSRLRTYANTHSPTPPRPSSVADNSETRILPPGALLSRGESLGVSNRAAYPRAPKFIADGPRPDSLLSTASWASAASGPRLHAHDGVRVHRAGSMSDSIMGSVSESISGSISGGDSSMDDSVEDLRTVEDCGPMLPIRVGADPRNSLIVVHPQEPITPKSHQFPPSALLAPPSSFAEHGTPGSIYSHTSPCSSNTDLHDSNNSRTPTASRIRLLRSPSATREIDTLRSRNSLLEVTNARLEADLKKARSDVSLRPTNASIYSSARTGSKRDSASTTKTATANKRDSALTIRDDGAGVYTQMNAGGGRSQADLAVPALLSEIEMLKRSGAQLQAELYAVRSQVSLLFPPTPAEMAELEARDPSGGLSSPGRMSTEAKPDRNPFRTSKHGGLQNGLVTPTLSSTSAAGMASPSPSSSRSHSTASTASTPLTPQMSTQWAQVQTGPGSTVKQASYDKYTSIPPAHFASVPMLAPVPATRATVPVDHAQPRPMSAFSTKSVNTLSSRTPPPRPPRRVSRLPTVPAANMGTSVSSAA